MKKISKNIQQLSFEKELAFHRFNHGGVLRKRRLGRGRRPLSTKEPLHVVFKIDKQRLRCKSLRSVRSFNLVHKIIKTYAKHFFVHIEQLSIQNDHCHLLVRTKRRSLFHNFFRVVAGQIAQIFEKEGLLLGVTDTHNTQLVRTVKKGTKLWLYRPFSRVIRGYKAYLIVRDYTQLNEKEALGQIKYNSKRLRGLTRKDITKLWN